LPTLLTTPLAALASAPFAYLSQGPKYDAEVAHRALLRHIKTLKAKIEGYEDDVTRLHGILRKGGLHQTGVDRSCSQGEQCVST
jgi:hypothetical protein